MNTRNATYSILLIISLLLCFNSFKTICAAYPAVSYRFLKPVAISELNDKQQSSVTYWNEEKKLISAADKSSMATAINVFGSPFLCYPLEFTNGSLGGGSNACAISSALAFKLFNSLDVLNLTAKAGAAEYVINGVFESKTSIIIYTAAKNDSFKNVEIEASLQKANVILQGERLPNADYIVDGEVVRTIFGAIVLLPMLIGAFMLAISMLKAAHNKERFVFILCIAIACALPLMLNALPSFLVPVKWSDFGFYEALIQNGEKAISSWFMLPPFLKEAAAKGAMLQCCLASLCSTLACIKLLKAK